MQLTSMQVFRPGYGFLPLIEGELPLLANGDILRVIVTTKYVGQKQTLTLYGAVGVRAGSKQTYPGLVGFDEALVGEGDLECPATAIPPTTPNVTGYVDIPIVVNYDAYAQYFIGYNNMLPPGDGFDLYVKIKEKPDINDEVDGVINLSAEGAGGTPPTPDILSQILPMIMMVMMFGMIIPIMGEGGLE